MPTLKHFFPAVFILVFSLNLNAQTSGIFMVHGDADKYYPVAFIDAAWGSNVATVLTVGRSHVHTDATWRGSLVASFNYHLSRYGHGSHFIDAVVHQYSGSTNPNFIAGWHDATYLGGDRMVVWLLGGNTTYYFSANGAVDPQIYDGASPNNSTIYTEPGGAQHGFKTTVDSYVNSFGISNSGTAFYSGPGASYFNGNIGIGVVPAGPNPKLHVRGGDYTNTIADFNTKSALRLDAGNPAISLAVGYNAQDQPLLQSYNNIVGNAVNLQINPYGGNVVIGAIDGKGYKLAVAGNMIAEKVKVKLQGGWPDYVFNKEYVLPSLQEVERFIALKGHLPNVPSAEEVKRDGIDVEDMNKTLLRKVEEVTLYLIELEKKVAALQEENKRLQEQKKGLYQK